MKINSQTNDVPLNQNIKGNRTLIPITMAATAYLGLPASTTLTAGIGSSLGHALGLSPSTTISAVIISAFLTKDMSVEFKIAGVAMAVLGGAFGEALSDKVVTNLYFKNE